jgi:nucleotide-binding universal stress UspA family protein
MYSKIMVPLDGSPLAEHALPYAVTLAKRLDAELLLLRVTEVAPLLDDTPDKELEVIKGAEDYLELVRNAIIDPASESALDPEKVRTLVAYGDSKRELTELAPFEKTDLIVMTTHGRTGLTKLVAGSVATKIVRNVDIPVVLIRPEKIDKTEPLEETLHEATSLEVPENNMRVVVTLDGTPEAEVAVDKAVELASNLGASLYLLRVVSPYTPMEYSDVSTGYVLDNTEETQYRREEAYKYLDKVQERITAMGFNSVKVVRIGNAADEITDYVSKVQASMVVMATHARGRLGSVLMGSVAEEIVRRSHLPVMVIHSQVPAHV